MDHILVMLPIEFFSSLPKDEAMIELSQIGKLEHMMCMQSHIDDYSDDVRISISYPLSAFT